MEDSLGTLNGESADKKVDIQMFQKWSWDFVLMKLAVELSFLNNAVFFSS